LDERFSADSGRLRAEWLALRKTGLTPQLDWQRADILIGPLHLVDA
jgi:hypothetical protein